MPNIGDVAKGRDIGKKHPCSSFAWLACECGKSTRWVELKRGVPKTKYCHSCAVTWERNYNWGGGTHITNGYRRIALRPDDFFYPMIDKKGFVLEHRLVMAKHLGRCLHTWEIIHHINGDRLDNRIENLQIVANDRHNQITLLQNKIRYLQKENSCLKTKIAVW